MATIKDVAALAGVSISTVSNGLNKSKYVSPEIENRVNKAVAKLNFSLNIAARNMRAKRSMIIGIIIPSFSRVFYTQVLTGLNEVASKRGYSAVLYSSEYEPKKEMELIHQLIQHKVDGIILSSAVDDKEKDYFRSLAQLRCGDKRVHVISIGRDFAPYGVHSITWDNVEGAKMATQAMIDQGARKIVCITAYAAGSSEERLRGYRAALEENNIPFEPSLCIRERGYAWTGYSIVCSLLSDGMGFDGIFAGNDQRAVGAIKAINEWGMRVPDDIQVVGFDNSIVASLIRPSLTTVNVPRRRLGREAMSILINLQEAEDTPDNNAPLKVLLPLKLIERGSTNSSLRTTWELEDW